MRYSKVYIDTIDYELAPNVVSSDELEERLAPLYQKFRIPQGQLESMTGIVERRFWDPGFKVSQGAALAAQNALARSDVPASELGALIYAGVCRDEFEPATACHVAAALREAGHPVSRDAAVLDISNACLGVMSGMLDIANRIELGQIRAGMVVSCESAREIVDVMIERMTKNPDLELFRTGIATMTGGSAAIAVILTDGSFGGAKHRLVGAVQKNAPEFHNLCIWGMSPETPGPVDADTLYRPQMKTDSVQVLEHGVQLGRATWDAFLAELGWNEAAVDKVVSHQVGSSHRKSYLSALNIQEHKDFIAYEFLGNTGTVALPLALAMATEREFIGEGDTVGLLGIGSGLNCLMVGVEW